MNVSVIPNTLSSRLAILLPGFDEATRATMAALLETHIRRLALRSWTVLVQRCAASLPPPTADALRLAGSRVPDPDLLMARLGGVITPAVLLCLPYLDSPALTAALLAHPDAQMREHTLDALQAMETGEAMGAGDLPPDHPDGGDAPAGCQPLRQACIAWSRRMLVAELSHIPSLSHVDRLSLQEELLITGSEPVMDRTEPHALSDALATAANRQATIILAERAGVGLDIAEMAIALRDPKMLLALCWQAGCEAAETLAVQIQLGHIPPDQALRMGTDDQWPLDTAAMQWQIAMLQDI